jgi:hypothetical protein
MRKLTPFGFRETLQDGLQMRRLDPFGLTAARRQLQHGLRDLILAIGRQQADRRHGFFQELCHSTKIHRSDNARYGATNGIIIQ